MMRFYLVFFVATTLPAVCQGADVSATWTSRLTYVEQQILGSKYKKAASGSARLEREMLHRVVRGSRVSEFLGKTAGLHAIALAGIGELDHAAWKWQMAVAFFPEIANARLEDFGDAGVALQARLSKPLPALDRVAVDWGEFDNPEIEYDPKPEFPEVQRKAGARVRLEVELIVGADGVPRRPKIVYSDGRPTLVYTTLLALRSWRFKPARAGGKPVPFIYELTVKFN